MATVEALKDRNAGQAKVKRLATRAVGCSASGQETEGAAECLKVEFQKIACEEKINFDGEWTWNAGKPLEGPQRNNIDALIVKHNGKEFGRLGSDPWIVMPFVELPQPMELFIVYKGTAGKDFKVCGHSFTLTLGEAGAAAAGGCCTIS